MNALTTIDRGALATVSGGSAVDQYAKLDADVSGSGNNASISNLQLAPGSFDSIRQGQSSSVSVHGPNNRASTESFQFAGDANMNARSYSRLDAATRSHSSVR